MLTPLIQNHNHNTRVAINHLLDIPQKETCHYGTYSMVFTASNVWNNILRKSIKTCYIVNLMHSRKPYFKDFSASMKIATKIVELCFIKLQFMVAIESIIHIVFFYEYSKSLTYSVFYITFSITISLFIYIPFSQHPFPITFFCLISNFYCLFDHSYLGLLWGISYTCFIYIDSLFFS